MGSGDGYFRHLYEIISRCYIKTTPKPVESVTFIRRSFERFVDWQQCAAVMQREAVTYATL
jgi:hypothetical protein